MTDERRESLGRWLGGLLEARTLLTLVVLIVGWIGNYYTQNARITALEVSQAQQDARLDKDLVPRQVLELQQKYTNEKLDSINTNVRIIQSQLDDYGPKSYVYRPYKGAPKGRVKEY